MLPLHVETHFAPSRSRTSPPLRKSQSHPAPSSSAATPKRSFDARSNASPIIYIDSSPSQSTSSSDQASSSTPLRLLSSPHRLLPCPVEGCRCTIRASEWEDHVRVHEIDEDLVFVYLFIYLYF